MYTVVEVAFDAPQREEALGSKAKFWYKDPLRGKCLFKQNRLGTGEDWAEKVSEQIALSLQIPCATYELATHDGNRGVISPRMHGEHDSLLMGNEILAETVSEYRESTSERGGNRHHTIENVLTALKSKLLPYGAHPNEHLRNAADLFVGYLLLDALIGNTDRHHENWACVATSRGADISLAPTFDHASSLGRELREEKRLVMLSTKDRNQTVEAYARRAKSQFYKTPDDPHPLLAVEAFELASQFRPDAAAYWVNMLKRLDDNDVRTLFDNIPSDCISASAADVAVRIVVYNKSRL